MNDKQNQQETQCSIHTLSNDEYRIKTSYTAIMGSQSKL
jgi:hypothetical protein